MRHGSAVLPLSRGHPIQLEVEKQPVVVVRQHDSGVSANVRILSMKLLIFLRDRQLAGDGAR